ncbi:TPA: hypothetical protein N0F65_008663 [Lagenidium giganteum]|uniref:mitogen-activated protein kinase kinase n=1 Tax=Lagenidium giganteum TaxID=4803 RepID=A0AAV2ZAC9_9STRA|nr:TPA: hypothetical protein N0F65_008663 [Lagenidium giganteum]
MKNSDAGAAAPSGSTGATAPAPAQDPPNGAQNARPVLLSRLTTDGPRNPLLDKYRKRGRVESAHYYESSSSSSAGHDSKPRTMAAHTRANGTMIYGFYRARHTRPRSVSLPGHTTQTDNAVITNIFPDINPRELRIAEVKSWKCDWMDREFPVKAPKVASHHAAAPPPPPPVATAIKPKTKLVSPPDELETAIQELSLQLENEEKIAAPPAMPGTPPSFRPNVPASTLKTTANPAAAFAAAAASSNKAGAPAPGAPKSKRPQLRLKLEDMPTPQQAEDRAQRAATRLLARRDAIEKAMGQDASAGGKGVSATQTAMLKLSLKSFSSGEESELNSPSDAGRHSAGSAYSPNHGMFTTKNVAVSEAGISSPDSACLHLQENLERVKEVGRGASGVVYKAIHIPTLKVVAVKDVPVYGRGQRRQMVRELHALYSNLAPIAEHGPDSSYGSRREKPKPNPYIVSFYDAFVDRPKNCICLVMEYMGAGSLQDIVLRGGCQNEKILARIATGVLKGLAHIHQKRMVHRDIKPHNLLANRQGEVKISDFGLARTLNDNTTTTKTFVGTLLYMAPERIGGGDYSYPADIWSFGLALVSVAFGRYPLPTQDGFFGLVDSVANEKCLELPADQFSFQCRDFVQLCLKINPEERPTAVKLLEHPFLKMYSPDETLREWTRFIESAHLCEDRDAEVESLGEAVYRHIYERCVKFSYQPQSDYGVSFLTQSGPAFSRREVSLEPVEMSLQLGLANSLGLPPHRVYEHFEQKRVFYSDKLLEDYCYSPQSWTASPGVHRRQQLFGSDSESPRRPSDPSGNSFWRKLQDSVSKFGKRKKKTEGRSSHRTSVA